MAKDEFEPGKNLGEEIKGLTRQELVDLVIELAGVIRAEAGDGYRGGVYPENLRRDAEGELVIGDGHESNWEGQELDFIAPELYWHGTKSQAADVYSLGLVLYYGLTGGRLPFAGESANPQLARMGGKAVCAPKGCSPRLREVLEKALAFQEAERYQSVGEFAVMLESCRDNKYLEGADGAKGIFHKEDTDLSEMEKLMMEIIGGSDAQASEPALDWEPEAPGAETIAKESAGADRTQAPEMVLDWEPEDAKAELDPEAFMRDFLAVEAPQREKEDLPPVSAEDLVAEYFGQPDEPEEETAQKPVKEEKPAPAVRTTDETETEDVRVYEPGKEKRQPIPVLVEEKNPALAPVVPKHQPRRTEVKYSSDPVKSREIGEQVQRRRKRPVVVVLLLCIVLVGVAAVAGIFLRDLSRRPDESIGTRTVTTPTPGDNAPQLGVDGTGSIVTPMPDPLIGTAEVRYEVVIDDAGWIEARAKAESMGGHLVVITSPMELEKVAEAIGQAGLARAWIGCYRFNGNYTWETDEYISYYPWDDGEPSEVDAFDGAAEDFIMLWNHNGWCYNDCRENPAADFPDYYSGSIGFVVEYGVGEKK